MRGFPQDFPEEIQEAPQGQTLTDVITRRYDERCPYLGVGGLLRVCSGKISPLSRGSEYGILCHSRFEDIDLK